MENIKDILNLIKNSRTAVIFTGAGISTLSGIKDFRGKEGIYKTFDAQKLFDLNYFYKDPDFYYKNSKDFIYNLDEKEPNIIHKVCAYLEEKGLIRGVITQNIDLLHQKAGSKEVLELHGTPSIHRCLSCDKEYSFKDISNKLNDELKAPKCEKCNGLIKPDITFFGEALPKDALYQAMTWSEQADLMFVLGSSLTVQPAASLPYYTLRNSGKIVIVNDSATALDNQASFIYRDLESFFATLQRELNNL